MQLLLSRSLSRFLLWSLLSFSNFQHIYIYTKYLHLTGGLTDFSFNIWINQTAEANEVMLVWLSVCDFTHAATGSLNLPSCWMRYIKSPPFTYSITKYKRSWNDKGQMRDKGSSDMPLTLVEVPQFIVDNKYGSVDIHNVFTKRKSHCTTFWF